MRKAVIAIGSNSTRMLTADCGGKELKNRVTGRVETRLFLGLNDGGALSTQAMENTAGAVLSLLHDAVRAGAEETRLIATSACREACNIREFEMLLLNRTGLELTVIPGDEEAACSYRAAADEGKCVLTDIGGGSTEYSLGDRGKPVCARSINIGASRLLKKGEINSLDDMQSFLAMAKTELRDAAREIRSLFRADKLIGVGGTCTTAASIKRGCFSGGEETEGAVLTMDTVMEQLEMLSQMTPEQRMLVPGLPAGRVLIMPHGLCILCATMELLGFDSLTVSVRTAADGWLLLHSNKES